MFKLRLPECTAFHSSLLMLMILYLNEVAADDGGKRPETEEENKTTLSPPTTVRARSDPVPSILSDPITINPSITETN